MYPLIEITTVPIEIEIKTTRAKLEPTKSKAEVEITRDKAGGVVSIKSRPIKVSIDTFEPRNPASTTMRTLPTTLASQQPAGVNSAQSGYTTLNTTQASFATQAGFAAQAGFTTASNPGYAATATYAQQGQLLLNGRIGEELSMKLAHDTKTSGVTSGATIQFLSDQAMESDLEMGELNIRYEMDKLNFDWRTHQVPLLEFTPGDIQLTITQRPEVLIKYIGGPLYVPPSSDPDYVPIDTQA